jgi:hypothetical protein
MGYVGVPLINNLQPVLSWEPSKDNPDATYDVAIWDHNAPPEGDNGSVSETSSGITHETTSWGKRLCYVPNITGTSYQVKTPLKNDAIYSWSVRIHSADDHAPWSSYTQVAAVPGLGTSHQSHMPFLFRTPASPDAPVPNRWK